MASLKGRRRAAPWSAEDKTLALEHYIKGVTLNNIAKLVGRTKPATARYIQVTIKALMNAKQTRALTYNTKGGDRNFHANLTPEQKKEQARLDNPELLNKPFYDLLSGKKNKTLTDAEVKFCWSYVASGDYKEALLVSKLDEGLYTLGQLGAEDRGGGPPIPVKGYEQCLRLRIAYLKSKPNIAEFIKKIREDAVFSVDVDKNFLQQEIMIQIDRLKSNKSLEGQKLLRDYIQLLGRTFGGFTDKVEVNDIDHAKTIAKLTEQASKSETLSMAIEKERSEAVLEEEILTKAEEEGNLRPPPDLTQ